MLGKTWQVKFQNMSEFVMEAKAFSMNKLKDAFHSLKSSKSAGYDDISYTVIKNALTVCANL